MEVWPNFFVVGAAKAGTTSVHAYLSQHPEVFFPAIKEPHYFAQIKPTREHRYSVEAITDRAAYLRLFRHAERYRVVGDASPSYLWHPQAASRIKRAVPDARILIILRDPIERAFSHYLMDYREGMQHEPFYDALRRDIARTAKGWGVSYLYYELGLYAAQVRRYMDVFGSDRVLLMLFDELRRDARQGLRKVAALLGIDSTAIDRIDVRQAHNAYAAVRSDRMRRLAGSAFARVLGQNLIPRRLGRYIFEEFFLRIGHKPPIDPRAHSLLRSLYEDDVAELERVVGRLLPELRRSWYANSALSDGQPARRDEPWAAPDEPRGGRI